MPLDQVGRAAMQFLGSLQVYSSSALQERAEQDFLCQPESERLTEEFSANAPRAVWELRLQQARELAERSLAWRCNRFYQRYVAEEIWVKSFEAVERRRSEFMSAGGVDAPLPAHKLVPNPNLPVPDYYRGVEWHLAPESLKSYDLQGPMFAAAIFPYVFSLGGFAAVAVGDDILAQRRAVIRQFRKSSYRRIYDPGCGGAGTLGLCRQQFPHTQLVGGDLALRPLTDGLRFSEKMGWDIFFRQEDARHVAEPDGGVDGVISYALHHELPESVSRQVLAEMFRILEPGGDIVISDPPPFRAVPPFQAALLAWETENRAEPYFIEAGITDLGEIMRDIGFIDVDACALHETNYPWVTRGRKPPLRS